MPGNSSDKEERFFREQELLIRLQIAAEERRAMAETEKQRLKEFGVVPATALDVPDYPSSLRHTIDKRGKRFWLRPRL